jgi:hypothetical protein
VNETNPVRKPRGLPEIGHGLVKFDPAIFFGVDTQNELDATWVDFKKLLKSTLGKRSCLVILDDIDDYFVGIEREERFIEALCRAVIDINTEMAPSVFFILLMKQGIWRRMFANPGEYDKIKSEIEFRRWDLEQCAAVLAGRIAERQGMKFNNIKTFEDVMPYFKREFGGTDDAIKDTYKLIFSYSANGPRDVIDLCNSVWKKFPTEKISAEMVSICLPSYSEEKLNGLHADYGHLYPGVQVFLQKVFKGAPSNMKGDQLATRILQNAMLDSKASKESFAGQGWFRDTTEHAMVKVLFDIGVIGVVKGKTTAVFSNEDGSFSQNQLLGANLRVHPAFRPALGIE